jgi:uncharacterized protein YggE
MLALVRTIAFLGIVALAAGGAAADESVPRVLGAGGDGEVSVPPDLAYVRLGVAGEAKQAEAAQRAVNEVANRVLAALKKLGVEDRDIQTVELQIGPVYASDPVDGRGNPGPPRIQGYSASNVVRVTVRDLAKLGSFVDAGLAAGANRVDSVEFGLRDDREARKEALRRAVRDARSKTEAMAEALGIQLGKLQSLREGSVSATPVYDKRVRMMAAESAMSTPTAPGDITVRASVGIEYAIE